MRTEYKIKYIKKTITGILAILFLLLSSDKLFSQSDTVKKELGFGFGQMIHFQNWDHSMYNLTPVEYFDIYLRLNKHEFNAGLVLPYPFERDYNEKITSCLGATAGYKFYLLKPTRRSNIFFNYSFEYLRFAGTFLYGQHGSRYLDDVAYNYFNCIWGIGYKAAYGKEQRFGFHFILGYMVSSGYYNETENYIYISLGSSFKLNAFKKQK